MVVMKRKCENKTLQVKLFLSEVCKSAHLIVLIGNVMSLSHLCSAQNLSLNAYVLLTCREGMTESSVIHEPCIHSLQRDMFYSSLTSFHHLCNILTYSANILFILIKLNILEILGSKKKNSRKHKPAWFGLKTPGYFFVLKFSITLQSY